MTEFIHSLSSLLGGFTILATKASGWRVLNHSSKSSTDISSIRSRQNSTADITSGDNNSHILSVLSSFLNFSSFCFLALS